MRCRFVPLLAACAALTSTVAAGAASTRLEGTVVKRTPSARSFVIVTESGRMLVVHSQRRPAIGRVTRVGARRLASGRWRASRVQVFGRRSTIRLRGAVAFSSAGRRLFRIATRGASVPVHAKAGSVLPRRGTRADLRVSIDHSGLLWFVSPWQGARKPGVPTGSGGSSGSSVGHVSRPGSASSGGSSAAGNTPSSRGSGFVFMDALLVGLDAKARTFTLTPEIDNAASEDDDLPDTGSAERNYGPPQKVTVARSIDMSRFAIGQRLRLVLQHDASDDLVVEDADVSGRDDDFEPDPEDGPADDTGPDTQG